MQTFQLEKLVGPGSTNTQLSHLYTDGETVTLFPMPGAVACVPVEHPPQADAPPGVSLANELKSFGAHYFRQKKLMR